MTIWFQFKAKFSPQVPLKCKDSSLETVSANGKTLLQIGSQINPKLTFLCPTHNATTFPRRHLVRIIFFKVPMVATIFLVTLHKLMQFGAKEL